MNPRRILAFAVLALASLTAGADGFLPEHGPPKFLPVDDAFQLQPAEWRKDRVVLRWQIAPGYYLYRNKLKFTAQDDAQLGAPALPDGQRRVDEVFGPVEIYRGELRAELPVTPPRALSLRVSYQGCADAGLCYPPQTRVLDVGPPGPRGQPGPPGPRAK